MLAYKWLIALAILLTQVSCSTRLYLPERANTPGFVKKGEGKLTGFLKVNPLTTDSSNQDKSHVSPSADAAYALTDHVAVFVSYRGTTDRHQYSLRHSNDTADGGFFDGRRYEAGAGYFKMFPNRMKMEVYLGGGIGELRRDNVVDLFDYTARYYRIFLQPAVGFHGGEHFSVTGGVRLAFNRVYDFQSPYPSMETTIMDGFSAVKAKTVSGTILGYAQPFANIEGGYRFFKLNAQLGLSSPLTNAAFQTGTLQLYAGLGITFHYDPAFFKRD